MSETKLWSLQNHGYQNVSDDQLESALRSGLYRIPAGQTLRAFDENGDPYEINNQTRLAELPNLKVELNAQKVEREKMAEAAEMPVTAAVTGALRGASFGVSDALGSALGYGEDLRRLKEANPIASGIGEVGGTVGSIFLLPGGGLVGGAAKAGEVTAGLAERAIANTVAKGAAETATSSLARDIAARAARGAITKGAGGFVEGSLYGLGQTLSEASLGDPKEAAEHLVSNVGFSGLINGSMMAVGGAFGGILANAHPGISKEEVATIRSQIDNLKSATGEINDGIAQELNNTAQKLVDDGKITDPGLIEKIKSGISSGADIAGLMQGALTGTEFRGPVEKLANKYVDLIAKTRGLDEDTVKTLKEVFTDPKQARTVLDYMDNAPEAMQQLGRNFQHIAEVAENSSQAMAINTRRASIDAMPTQYAQNIEAGRSVAQEAKDAVTSLYNEMRGTQNYGYYDIASLKQVDLGFKNFNSAMDGAVDNRDVLNNLINLKRTIGSVIGDYKTKIARTAAENNTYREFSNLYSKLVDLTHNEAAFSPKVVGENKAIDKAVNEFMNVQTQMQQKFYSKGFINGQAVNLPDPQKFFSFIRSPEARQMLKNDIFEQWTTKTADLLKTAQSLGIQNEMFQNAGQLVDGFVKATQELKQTKAAALAVSSLESHTGKSLQRMMYGSAIGSIGGPVLGGIGAGLGYAIDNPVQVLRLLNRAQETIVNSKQTMASVIDKFAGMKPKVSEEIGESAIKPGPSTNLKGFSVPQAIRLGITQEVEPDNKKPVSLQTVLSTPTDETVSRVLEKHGELNTVMPGISAQIGAQTAAAVDFLKSKMPTDPSTPYQMFPTKQPYVMPESVRAKFERYVDAINDPMGVLKNMADGKLTAEHVEALKSVYPSLYAEAQRTVTEVLSQKNDLTFRQKVQLGTFMQVPTMPAYDPKIYGSIQSQYAIAAAQEQQKGMKVPETLGQQQSTEFQKAITR